MMIADMHCDTIMKIWYSHLRNKNGKGHPLFLRDTAGSGEELQIDLRKLRQGEYFLQNFALFIDLKTPAGFNGVDEGGEFLRRGEGGGGDEEPRYMDPWKQFTEMVAIYHAEVAANPDLIREARTWKDIETNRRDGRISAVLTVEEGGVLRVYREVL